MLRYTQPDSLVWDPMAGSGTTLDVAKQLGRRCIASDLNPIRGDIVKGDAQNFLLPDLADLIILHPPYFDIIQFSEDDQDLSNCATLDLFLYMLERVGENLDRGLKAKGWLALVVGDYYRDGQLVPLGYLCAEIWRIALKNYKLKVDYIKDIQGNAQDNTTNLWYYRHNKNGTAVFKHEHIFVFRKEYDVSR